MFGLSFAKIVVLVLVVSLVWFGFRWFQRWEKESAARNAADPARKRDRVGSPRELSAEDMVACPVCGAYVSARGATSCGKPGCPYPR